MDFDCIRKRSPSSNAINAQHQLRNHASVSAWVSFRWVAEIRAKGDLPCPLLLPLSNLPLHGFPHTLKYFCHSCRLLLGVSDLNITHPYLALRGFTKCQTKANFTCGVSRLILSCVTFCFSRQVVTTRRTFSGMVRPFFCHGDE